MGRNTWKNGRKTHILDKFRRHVPVQVRVVPVQVRVVPVQVVFCFSILTSIRILAITCSFLIRFELFKLIVKIDFKENQTF